MSCDPSDRLLDQRLRNRMMEELMMLVDWKDTIATIGAGEYFNSFFDFFPNHPPLHSNSTLTQGEREALTRVLALMNDAADATTTDVTDATLVASGWPQRIAPEAQKALSLMHSRGKFSERMEEQEPSGTVEG